MGAQWCGSRAQVRPQQPLELAEHAFNLPALSVAFAIKPASHPSTPAPARPAPAVFLTAAVNRDDGLAHAQFFAAQRMEGFCVVSRIRRQ